MKVTFSDMVSKKSDAPVSRFRRKATQLCSVESWKKRLPITIWLPKYTWATLLRDAIAGITVGLTSIPQGIAYALVAGLPPQVGLYSSIFPGYVYMLFGSVKDVTVGPTAILAALLAKYVARSADFAYLAAFLSGCLILLLGVLQLGFLLDFISKPVISGFTTAAALQIGAAQLKSLFRIKGASGDTFISAVINFFKNITTVQLWDSVLGVSSIITLLLFKRWKIDTTDNSDRRRVLAAGTVQYLVRARNALVVFGAALVAYILYTRDNIPFQLTGTIEGGLPHFGPPPFETVIGNQTLAFGDMLSVFGVEGFVMPLVAILESIAIAKAFAGAGIDATQEMVALGLCNMVASFAQSMPATGSFTRTALNHASGVLTPAGAFFKATLVLLAVTLLSQAFYFIPRATLAGVIIVAMTSLVEIDIIKKLWRHSKLELVVYSVTVVVGTTLGLEYGIAVGCGMDVLRVLANAARPTMQTQTFKVGHQDCMSITLVNTLSYASAQYVDSKLKRLVPTEPVIVVLDGRHLRNVDIGVAENLLSVILELETYHNFLLWNFSESIQKLFEDLHPGFQSRFVDGASIDPHVLNLEIRSELRRNVINTF